MKTKSLFIFLNLISFGCSYSDTAPLFWLPIDPSKKLPYQYISNSDAIKTTIEQLSHQICVDSNQPLIVYKVPRLLSSSEISPSIANVHYSSLLDTELSLDAACHNIPISYIDSTNVHDVTEFMNPDMNILIQGIPSFHSTIDDVKDYFKDHLGDISIFQKRSFDSNPLSPEKYEALSDDVKKDIEAAEQLVLLEPDIIEHGKLRVDGNSTNKFRNSTKQGSNLFVNYSFFTPGILLCLIISFILMFILYVAIGWLSSIEISYNAFEKQVDLKKKIN